MKGYHRYDYHNNCLIRSYYYYCVTKTRLAGSPYVFFLDSCKHFAIPCTLYRVTTTCIEDNHACISVLIYSNATWSADLKEKIIPPLLITPRACAGVKESVCPSVCQSVCQSIITMKITRSRDLGIWATRKHNQSVRISEKLAWMCFESFVMVHNCHK